MSVKACSLHPLLLDPRYWRQRLDAVSRVPRNLLVYPRPDLARAGADVSEISVRTHDGERLTGLLARTSFVLCSPRLRVILEPDLELISSDGTPQRPRPSSLVPAFEWEAVLEGESQVVFRQPIERRLEDRVLDLVRMVGAARTLAGLEANRIEIVGETGSGEIDELRIATRLFGEGWV